MVVRNLMEIPAFASAQIQACVGGLLSIRLYQLSRMHSWDASTSITRIQKPGVHNKNLASVGLERLDGLESVSVILEIGLS